ncbi:hypothetical protein E3N88_36678 [Mikania micrantha]|uniref:Uncharacterized protein n=1 Tax=Mikania micrantha TaxID=192012 RepID=A0A5N6M4Z2_9ASTR|nr:hypothetical protein E3N88_36678 [Mikania micrantha]
MDIRPLSVTRRAGTSAPPPHEHLCTTTGHRTSAQPPREWTAPPTATPSSRCTLDDDRSHKQLGFEVFLP